MLKNKILTITLTLFLALPVYSEELIEELPNINNEIVSELADTNVDMSELPHKKPISKRKIAKKFIYAMCGVGVSSIFLFIVLTLYNKIRENLNITQEEFFEESTLKSPSNETDAIKIFLDKTKWDN